MKILKFSVVALLLGIIVLASSASAAGWTQAIGGVQTSTINGGTTGTYSNQASYTDDRSANINGYLYQYALDEIIGVKADVAIGKKGEAIATWSSGPKSYSQSISGGSLSTSLDGSLTASVTKTSSYGAASAYAVMEAKAGVDNSPTLASYANNGVGGLGQLNAHASLSGVGTALAEVADGSATYNAVSGSSNAALGTVAGNIKITAENLDSSSSASNGGTATGDGIIYGYSHAQPNGWGYTRVNSELDLSSDRSTLYSGKSYVDGAQDSDTAVSATSAVSDHAAVASSYYVSGSYASQSYDPSSIAASAWHWQPTGWVSGYWWSGFGSSYKQITDIPSSTNPSTLTWVYNPETSALYAHTTVVSSDATASMEAEATSLLKRDTASANSYVRSSSHTDEDGNSFATSDIKAYGQVERDSTGGAEKATAEAYVTDATWESQADTSHHVSSSNDHLASVTGTLDALADGQSGLGAGAWIQHYYSLPQTASVDLTQTADTTGAGVATSTYELKLDGVKATGTIDDAVGAYGAVADQSVVAQNVETLGLTVSNSPLDTAAIEWLEGGNTDYLPGYYSPSTMTVTTGSGALNRHDDLVYSPAAVYSS